MPRNVKTRVLFVVPNVTSYSSFLREVSAAMSVSGFDVHCACDTRPLWPAPDAGVAETAAFHYIPMPRGMDVRAHRAASLALRRLVDDLQPEVIHAHFSAAVFTTALAQRPQWPATLATFHGLTFPVATGMKRSLMRVAEGWAARRFARTSVLTDDDRLALQHATGMRSVVREPGFGVGCDLRRFDARRFAEESCAGLRSQLGIGHDDFVVTFVGRFTAFKGFADVCRGFVQAGRTNPRLRLLLVGERDAIHSTGLPATELDALLGSARVIQVGWQPATDEYLAISDVVALPSRREGMPVCLMEALAMGIPVVTAATRGCRDVVRDGIDGFVLSRCGPSEIARAIEALASNVALHRRFAENARAARQRFDRHGFVAHQLKVYSHIVSGADYETIAS